MSNRASWLKYRRTVDKFVIKSNREVKLPGRAELFQPVLLNFNVTGFLSHARTP